MGLDGGKVTSFHPADAFIGVPSFGPAPQTLEDRMINGLKDLGTDDMPVILCPPADEGVEETDQRSGSGALVGVNNAPHFPVVSPIC